MTANAEEIVAPLDAASAPARRRSLYPYYVLAVLCLANAFANLDRFAFFLLIPYIKKEFHAGDTAIGLVSGIAFIGAYVLLGIPVARWVDRGPRVKILALSMGVWSCLNMLGGLAGSMLQLGFARAGLGAGEAAAVPASNSLIGDYFDKKARPAAVAFFQAGMGFGAVIGSPLVALVATTHGWRAALVAMGLPGVLLAVVTWFTVREPERGRMDVVSTSAPMPGGGLGAALKRLFSIPSFCLLVGSQLMVGVAAGILPVWFPVYLIRAFHLGLPQVGGIMGLLNGVVLLAGFAVAGFLASLLVRREMSDRWIALIPATSCLLAAPLLYATMGATSAGVVVTLAAVYFFMQFISRPAAFALSIELSTPGDRGLSASIIVIAGSLVGAGLGPLIIGAISDHLVGSVGPAQALGTAIVAVVVPAMAIAGLCFLGMFWTMRTPKTSGA